METRPLHEYVRKRHFGRTPEPGVGMENRPLFVVQKHHARRLHYDLRLEMDGVLKSWAVPKGPSYDPAEKRLAVHVEDHPLEYADFEGVIPKGEYGSGPVMVWDVGTWEPVGNPHRSYEKGRLHFKLHGARLQGEWALARMSGAAAGEAKENWLLVKVADAVSRARFHDEARFPEADVSVLSGRTFEQISRTPGTSPELSGPPKGALFPPEITPQLATLVECPARGEGWLHEIKFDGYRILAQIHERHVRLISRNGKEWTNRFVALANALRRLPIREGWLDGEVALLLPDGRTDFSALQLALSEKRDGDLVYFLFDLLYRDGADLRALPLAERKAALADLLADLPPGSPLRYTDHLVGEGDAVYSEACRLGLEGLVSKRAEAPHRVGRGREWLKVKCLQRQEFVIGGFTAPRGARNAFGALLVGVYEGGRLIYAGRVGTGFDERTLSDLYARMAPLVASESPFDTPVPEVGHSGRRKLTWIRPELVAEVAFAEWTRDDVLRQAVFQGLREDKAPREVVREQIRNPTPTAAPPVSPEIGEKVSPRNGDSSRVAGLRLSHPDKILFPDADPEKALNKRDIALYYESVADQILPDLVGRPLTLLRCPDGEHFPCFYQKHATEELPSGITRIPIVESDGRGIYLAVENIAGVVGLVQMGVLEIHTWGAHGDNPDAPDRIVFDLDPDEGLPWESVVEAVHLLREALDTLGLVPFLRATGGKGLHVVVPLVRRHTWPEAKSFAHALARTVVHAAPRAYTINPSKPARRGKVYIDYLRNGRGATAIANFSTRAKPGAPVAVPLRWDELGTPSSAYRVTNVRARIALLEGDPWEGYREAARMITKPMKRALGMK